MHYRPQLPVTVSAVGRSTAEQGFVIAMTATSYYDLELKVHHFKF